MTRKRCTGKALAERRRRAMQLHLAGFTQEEIADKLGVDRSVVCRDLQSLRDTWRSGDSPDLEEARITQRLSGNGDRHPTRCMRLRPGTLHPGASPPFRAAIQSRGGGRILERKEDLRPAGRWIRPPTEVVISICNLMQFNDAIQRNLRKCPQFHENSRKPLQIPASSSRTEELPSPTCKPFCEVDLHRRIRSFFLYDCCRGVRRRVATEDGSRGFQPTGNGRTLNMRRVATPEVSTVAARRTWSYVRKTVG